MHRVQEPGSWLLAQRPHVVLEGGLSLANGAIDRETAIQFVNARSIVPAKKITLWSIQRMSDDGILPDNFQWPAIVSKHVDQTAEPFVPIHVRRVVNMRTSENEYVGKKEAPLRFVERGD
jgi:hypothetical protein